MKILLITVEDQDLIGTAYSRLGVIMSRNLAAHIRIGHKPQYVNGGMEE